MQLTATPGEDGRHCEIPNRANYGPNYCTAMAVLALTVEYRFLPIYQRVEEPAEK